MASANTDRESLIRRYEAGPAKVRAALAKVPAEAMKWRPAPGKWSVHEIICHCADSEMNAASRIRYVLCEEKPLIVGYDQDRWAEALDYHAQPLESALAVMDSVRANTVPLLRRLPESAWSRKATHTESGEYGSQRWLETYAKHLEDHAAQIERTLLAWKSRK